MLITSKQNSIIKHANQLKEPKYSKLYHECLVESEKVIRELLNKNQVEVIFVEDKKITKFNELISVFKGKIYLVNEIISKYLTDSTTSSGIFAIVKINQNIENPGDKILILDNLQDPSNLGSIVRSAVAFGFSSIVLVGGIYPYTPKAIRSSMGYIFNVNIISFNYDELVDFLQQNKYNLVCADMSGNDLNNFKYNLPIALIIGNEGNGVSDKLKQMSNYVVKIPMKNGVESLNASVSASIIMYKLGE